MIANLLILTQLIPLNLRHVDLQGDAAEVSDKAGLRFRVSDKAYAKVKALFFYSLADGDMFVGSWADSFFGIRSPLQLPVELFDGYQGNQSAMIVAIPGLRPSATINQGERITSVTLPAIKWTTQSVAA